MARKVSTRPFNGRDIRLRCEADGPRGGGPGRQVSADWKLTVGGMRADVLVWQVDLDRLAAARPTAPLLAADERERAGRFATERLRTRFTAARAALRDGLGQILGVPPDALRFSAGPHGKPRLVPTPSIPAVEFNVAHSEGLAIFACSVSGPVGVDVERVWPIADLGHVAHLYFSASEQAALMASAPHARLAAFYRCWTRKEAFVKASGVGLRFPLDRFDVTFGADEPPTLTLHDAPLAAAAWRLEALPVARGYEAAIACRSTAAVISTADLVQAA